MNLLAIEAATDVLSVAVLAGDREHERTIAAGQRHAELVLGVIDGLLERAGLAVRDLDAVAYGAGPGSFTGLRIACGVAQGIAAARGIPMLGIGTLASMAAGVGAARVIACLDARMGEVYHAAYEQAGDARMTSPSGESPFSDLREVIPPGLYRPDAVPLPPGEGWIGCGPGFAVHGAALARRLGPSLHAIRADVMPSAGAVARLARPRLAAGEGVDPALAAPLYLRDRVALKTRER
jgi:tRNA threonylcarbamoyladenosine biosynthesis protein TsaB